MHFQGHEFRDPTLFELALTHASASETSNNERLEFLGDAALDLVVADALFGLQPTLSEGEMTEIKSVIVSRPTLSRVARELGLDQRARVGPGLRGRALPASVLANLLEAALGAIYVDGGLDAARRMVMDTLGETIGHAVADYGSKNPKQRLQHIAQARWSTLPTYELVESRGSAHAKAFLMRARIGDASFPSAWGRTRKESERWAAFEALLVLDTQPSSPDGATAPSEAPTPDKTP